MKKNYRYCLIIGWVMSALITCMQASTSYPKNKENLSQQLLDGIERKDLSKIKLAIKSFQESNISFNDVYPLHWAVHFDSVDAIQVLCNAGCDIDAQNKNGDTPLHLAIFDNKLEIVKELRRCGAQLGILNKQKTTADMLVTWFDYTKQAALQKALETKPMTKEALNKKEAGECLLTAITQKESIEKILLAIKNLKELGVSLDDVRDKYSQTALHLAAYAGQVELIKALLDEGSAIDVQDSKGVTPLATALGAQEVGAVKLLYERGARLDIKDTSHNETPLDMVDQMPDSYIKDEILSVLKVKRTTRLSRYWKEGSVAAAAVVLFISYCALKKYQWGQLKKGIVTLCQDLRNGKISKEIYEKRYVELTAGLSPKKHKEIEAITEEIFDTNGGSTLSGK